MKTGVILAALLLSGCAAFGPPQGMSAEQLAAYSKDKNSSAVCWTVIGPGWVSKVSATNLDTTAYAGGAISVTPDCAMTISSDVVPRPPRAPSAPSVHVPEVVPLPVPGTPSAPITPVPGASFVPPITYAINSLGECVRTERSPDGRVIGARVLTASEAEVHCK